MRELQPKNSSLLIGCPPSNGRIKSWRLDSFLPTQAIILPSAEMEGVAATKSVSCTGSPPSMETFHRCQSSVELKRTHFPSGDIAGLFVAEPCVSWVWLLPSRFMRQI